MLQVFRTTPVLFLQVALLAAGIIVCTLVGFMVSRSGASLRSIYWMLGLLLLVVGPQFAATLLGALSAVHASAPRTAALQQLTTETDPAMRRSAATLVFGPDAHADLVSDVRERFSDALPNAEIALFAALPNGESVLLARFKGGFTAEKGWIAYLRQSGLNQLGGQGDSQRGYAVTRPGGDRAYVLHFLDMVGVWTGPDDQTIRQRMAAGGVDVPRRAPLAGTSPAARSPIRRIGPVTTAALVALNLLVVILYFFRGAAWAGTHTARSGSAPIPATELAARLESINTLDVPFRIEPGDAPDEWFATWRYADAKWIDLARARGLRRTFRIRLSLDERRATVRATDFQAQFDGSVGRGGATFQWKASLGLVLFQREHLRVFGLQLDDQGRFKPEPTYAYSFNVDEMKEPLIAAVTRAGWSWRPTLWQGPTWLRWLTG